MKWFKRGALVALLAALCLILGLSAGAQGEPREVTVLFTHDLHSHLLSAADTDGGQYGGYARLMTVISQQREKDPNAVLVDGGDFSMGSLFQTAYTTRALELRIMGAMGYDVTTFGNHEFDYLPQGLAKMLTVAAESGDPVPMLVDANYLPPMEGQTGYTADSQAVWDAFDRYGVEEYVLLERGGIWYAIFGIIGKDSDDCAPNSGMDMTDPVRTAQTVVDKATAQCLEENGVEPVVICLSHGGTAGGKGEDYDLAKGVTGIHLIVSAHTHTTLEEPIAVGGTYIVSAGEYGKYLGVCRLSFDGEKAELLDYELIRVDENVPEDPQIGAMVEDFKTAVEEDYLSRYGLTFDQVLTENPYTFDTVDDIYATAHESTLGNLFSDAYKKAAEDALGVEVDLALTAAGVIRESLPVGPVTVSDVFNAASLGVGTEGELVAVYLTGAELMNVMEVDASVQPLMPSAQLFCSGVEYSFNQNRMIFNKVDKASLRRNDGTLEPIAEDKLYLVVTGMYAGQMLGAVEESSYGLMSIVPKTADGETIPMDQLHNYVIRDAAGEPVKEWFAIAEYLQDMGNAVDERYRQPDGRKTVYASWKVQDLLRNSNWFTWAAIALVMLLLMLLILIVRWVIRRIRRKKKAD